MENQDPTVASPQSPASVWLSPGLSQYWPPDHPVKAYTDTQSSWRVSEEQHQLRLSFNGRPEIQLPLTSANIVFLADYVLQQSLSQPSKESHNDTAIQELANLASPLFFGDESNMDVRPFLDKIANTISLKNGLGALFSLKWFENHSPGLLLVHQKGEARAWQIGAGHEDAGVTRTIEIEHFNQLFTAVRKTKTGQYSTQVSKWSWLPFSGAFLAEPFAFKNFNAILLATRQEFLPFDPTEVAHFHSFAGLLGLWLEDLIEGEFSDLRLAEVMLLLERSPLPIVLHDHKDQPVFINNAYQQNGPATLHWLPLGRGYNLGLGIMSEWENADIDVLHRHKVSLLGDLFNTLGHELSNPLFGLSLAADLLVASTDHEESAMILGEIQKNIKRCQLIIQNLTRLYADDDQEGVCDLKVAIKEALTLAKSELKGVRQDTTGVATKSDSLTVEGKPVLIVQILFNLLVNSAQAMMNTTPAPQIALRVSEEGPLVLVDIIDNGPGLPAAVRESLFRPFATTKAKGHGLGLALSRNLALKAGGDLSSLNPPQGAAFRLSLRKVPT